VRSAGGAVEAVAGFGKLLRHLWPIEADVLRQRFGLVNDEERTLDEIGMRFEVTRERIRQIEAKALKKLRHPGRSEAFARMALGLQPEENPLAQSVPEPEGDDAPDTAEPIPQPAKPKRQAAPRPPREPAQPAGSSKPSSLDQLLAKALELGILVNDERQSAGSIWVELLEPRDNAHRRLIRKLLDFGFAFWPGKGYWK